MPLGRTRCAEIWYVVRDSLARRFTKVDDGLQLHGRTPFPCLGNGWMDRAEIWCVVRDPLVWRFIKVDGGAGALAHLRTRRCVPLSVSRKRLDGLC